MFTPVCPFGRKCRLHSGGALASAMPPLDADFAFESTLTAAATNLFAAVAREPAPWRLLMVPAVEAPPEVLAHVEAGRAFALASSAHW